MAVEENWAENQGVWLHYLDNGAGGPGVPLFIVPGLSEGAEDYLDLMADLAPRRVVAISLRGRGRSDVPAAGYGLADHVADVAAVVEACQADRFCLFGYSRGVSYAAAFAAEYPNLLAGLILGDYPAHHTALPGGFAEWFMGTSWRGRPVTERMTPEAVRRIARDSESVPLWDRLGAIRCPALILRGGSEESLLSAEDAARYLELLPDARVRLFPEAGHALWEPDYGRYVQVLSQFLGRLD